MYLPLWQSWDARQHSPWAPSALLRCLVGRGWASCTVLTTQGPRLQDAAGLSLGGWFPWATLEGLTQLAISQGWALSSHILSGS